MDAARKAMTPPIGKGAMDKWRPFRWPVPAPHAIMRVALFFVKSSPLKNGLPFRHGRPFLLPAFRKLMAWRPPWKFSLAARGVPFLELPRKCFHTPGNNDPDITWAIVVTGGHVAGIAVE